MNGQRPPCAGQGARRARATPAVLLALALAVPADEVGATHAVPAGEIAEAIRGAEPPVVLDVRTVKEYRAGHIPGAVNIPIAELARRLVELAPYRARPMVVHCESGPRAWHAARMLSEAGFTDVHELDGHMRAWRGAGYPLQ